MAAPRKSRSNTPPRVPPPPPPLGLNAKLFKKCKSATFQIDGATYTIGLYNFIKWKFIPTKKHKYNLQAR